MGRFIEHHKFIVDLAVTSPLPNNAIGWVFLPENATTIGGVYYDSLAVTFETFSIVFPDTSMTLDVSPLAISRRGVDITDSAFYKNVRFVTPGSAASGDNRPVLVGAGSTTPADVVKTYMTNGLNASGVPFLFGLPLITIRVATAQSTSAISGLVKITLDWSTGG